MHGKDCECPYCDSAHIVTGDIKPSAVSGVIQPAVPHRKLFEIRATVEYAVVIAAEKQEEALEHVKTWEHAWDSSSDLLGVFTVEIADVREPSSQDVEDLENEAHEVV